MCNPVAIGIIGLAASVGGGLLSAKATANKAQSDQNYYNHLADVAESNITEVRQSAEYDRKSISDTTARETQANLTQTKQIMGSQVAASAANGTGLGSVTSADIMRDTLNKYSLDEMFIRFNADTQKYLITKKENADAKNLAEQARGYRAGGESARAAGNLQVAAGLLSTAGQVANSYYNYKTRRGN